MREQGQLSQTAGGQIICLFKELILKDSSPSNLCIFMNPKVRFYSPASDSQRKTNSRLYSHFAVWFRHTNLLFSIAPFLTTHLLKLPGQYLSSMETLSHYSPSLQKEGARSRNQTFVLQPRTRQCYLTTWEARAAGALAFAVTLDFAARDAAGTIGSMGSGCKHAPKCWERGQPL